MARQKKQLVPSASRRKGRPVPTAARRSASTRAIRDTDIVYSAVDTLGHTVRLALVPVLDSLSFSSLHPKFSARAVVGNTYCCNKDPAVDASCRSPGCDTGDPFAGPWVDRHGNIRTWEGDGDDGWLNWLAEYEREQGR